MKHTCEGSFSAEVSMKFFCFCLATEIQLGDSALLADILPTASENNRKYEPSYYFMR